MGVDREQDSRMANAGFGVRSDQRRRPERPAQRADTSHALRLGTQVERVLPNGGFTPQQAALALGGKAFGWTPFKVRKALRSGRIVGRMFGGRWMIGKDEIERLKGKK